MNEMHQQIIQQWLDRAKAQFLVHPEDIEAPDLTELTEEEEDYAWDNHEREVEEARTTYCDRQLEFFLGAHTALLASGQPGFPEMFLVILSVGRKSSEFLRKE